MTIEVAGLWFDGKTSDQVDAVLRVGLAGDYQLRDNRSQQLLTEGLFSAFAVSPRLGNTPRYLELFSGEKFETLDNSAVDGLQNKFISEKLSRTLLDWVYQLESKFHYALGALLVVFCFSWAMLVYGVPALAHGIAQQLPDSVSKVAGEQTLQALDKVYFSESTLSADKVLALNGTFQMVFDQFPHLSLKVVYRHGDKIGANAFALPDGTIVFTDEMVALAASDEELLSVLLHEIGHIEYRHGMQAAVQNSLLLFVLMFISGDVSGTAEVFLALPVILTEMAYSREFERRADDFSIAYLTERGIDTQHFANFMQRLQASKSCQQEDEKHCSDDISVSDHSWLDYFSSHPSMEERLIKFK